MKKLPDSEFTVMKAVWSLPIPMTAGLVLEAMPAHKDWKVQTVITLLARLVEKGFLSTEKQGKERLYRPLISREDYLRFETGNFLREYHDNSFTSFVATLYNGEQLRAEDTAALLKLLEDKED